MAGAADVQMAEAEVTCSICYGDFEKGKRVCCCYCNVNTCTDCVKAYLLQSFQDPHCHSCKRGWSDVFLGTILTKTVINTALKKHRQAIWLERQRALLPGRQALVENEVRIRKANAAIKALEVPIKELTTRLISERNLEDKARFTSSFLTYFETFKICSVTHAKCDLALLPTSSNILTCRLCNAYACDRCGCTNKYDPALPHLCVGYPITAENLQRTQTAVALENDRLRKITTAIIAERNALHARLSEAQRSKYPLLTGLTEKKPQQPKAAFVRACPADGCRGFLSTAWKCGVCEGWACSNCHEYIGADKKTAAHACNPDQVASARLLDKETKPCPKCASAIFKISGCDQMWCTACNSGFNWRDGRPIETRAIHNPHFFEYMSKNNMQQQTGEAVQQLCMDDNLPTLFTVMYYLRLVNPPLSVQTRVLNTLRFATHVQGVCMRRYQRLAGRDSEDSEEKLAVMYLMKDITEKSWMERLQRAEKRQRKYRMFADIFESYVAACTDIFRGVCSHPSTPTHIAHELGVTHCEEIWRIATDAMQNVCKLYDCKMPRLDFEETGAHATEFVHNLVMF
jgi:hypothetical protein